MVRTHVRWDAAARSRKYDLSVFVRFRAKIIAMAAK
jgi:hypothetical protein